MFNIAIFAAMMVLLTGCAMNTEQAERDAAVQVENDRLKGEAAQLREEVEGHRLALEALKQRPEE